MIVFICLYLLSEITLLFLPNDLQDFYNKISINSIKSNADYFKLFILSFDPYSYLVFIIVQIIQVVFAPIPGQVTGILGGYIFGFTGGLLYTMIGLLLGSYIAMLAGRTFGFAIISRIVSKKFLAKYDYLRSEKSLETFFIIFLLPYFPDDAICLVAGMTRIKLWKLIIICFLGRLPGMAVFSYMGSAIEENMIKTIFVFILAGVLATIYWLFDKDIKRFIGAVVSKVSKK